MSEKRFVKKEGQTFAEYCFGGSCERYSNGECPLIPFIQQSINGIATIDFERREAEKRQHEAEDELNSRNRSKFS